MKAYFKGNILKGMKGKLSSDSHFIKREPNIKVKKEITYEKNV